MMPMLPTTPRARSLWWLAAAVPLLLVSGCPQLASDDFTKAGPLDAGGSGGGGDGDTDGTGGIDLSTAAQASGGSATTSSTSQGGSQQDAGADAGSDAGGTDATDADTSTGTGGDAGTGGTSTETSATVGGSAGTGGGATTDATGGTGGSSTGGEPECVDEMCDGRDNDCDDEVDEEDVCEGNWGCQGFPFGDGGYMFCARPASVDEARAECDRQGMTLVQIDSAEENAALVAAADTGWGGASSGGNSDWGSTGGWGDQQEAFWTDGSDEVTEESWIWTDSGTPFWKGAADGASVDSAYENWGDGRPNQANDEAENCAAVYMADGEDGDAATWNDLPCGDPYPFICELP